MLFQPRRGNADLAARLRRAVAGMVMFDPASRGRYATDASIYQVEPVGVLVPSSNADVEAALGVCRDLRVPVLPRGAGSSQCGQTVGAALVIDHSKHLNRIVALDKEAMTVTVEPGVVLDQLNAWLKPHGLWFPVDVSTSAQATLGGMAGNNSCGSRSIAYGNMVHNVHAVDALLSDGTQARLGPEAEMAPAPAPLRMLLDRLRAIGARERDEIAARVPAVMRRVGGYNIDVFNPQSDRAYTTDGSVNFAHLLVGSEGTLAWTRQLALKVCPLPLHRALGVVNFPSLYRAMECARHLVALGPSAVELVDRTMIDLARDNPAFRPVIDAALTGEPEAILLVEFTGDDADGPRRRLEDLVALMGDLGLSGSVVRMTEAAAQKALWDVRKAGLNIMMSLRGDGKPVSFIEDCAVPLSHLPDYVDRLTQIFRKHGTRGTWYAHASVGTLHVRPILDMRRDGAAKMRAIAEEASAMVREYKGAFSGEHGDGLVRSEWVAWQFGPRLTRAFVEIKDLFDPAGLMNPGKIVRASRMDDPSLFRFPPGYRTLPVATALDWSAWNVQNDPLTETVSAPGTGGDPAHGFAKAIEMCNNNGHCRKFDAGTMCPSYRVTRDEAHLTRGRANTLRLALSGQLGPDFVSQAGARCTRPLRELQGLPPRLPDGRGHGEDENRVHVPLAARARAKLARTHDRPHAALGAEGCGNALAVQSARRHPGDESPGRKMPGRRQATLIATLAPRYLSSGRRDLDWQARRRCGRRRAFRGHLHQLLRAGECARRRGRAARRELPRACRARRRGRRATGPPALLRPHVPRGGNGRRSEARGAARRGRDGATCRAWRRHRRAGAVVPADASRRVPRHGDGRRRTAAERKRVPDRGIPGSRASRRAARPAARAAA